MPSVISVSDNSTSFQGQLFQTGLKGGWLLFPGELSNNFYQILDNRNNTTCWGLRVKTFIITFSS